MHAVGALVVVGGQLGGRDEVDAVLHGMGIGVAHAPNRIVVGDGQMGHPAQAARNGSLSAGGRTVGEGRMGMQITGHGRHLTCECGCYGTYYYTTSRGRIASRASNARPLQILRYFRSFLVPQVFRQLVYIRIGQGIGFCQSRHETAGAAAEKAAPQTAAFGGQVRGPVRTAV